jgi:hypothetical protein
MDRKALIETIVNEVKDEELRDKLLKQIAEDDTPPSEPSLVKRELDLLGLNPDAAQQFLGFGIRVQMFAGYVVGTLFLVGGGFRFLNALSRGRLDWFEAGFAVAGAVVLAYARILSRMRKKP